MTQLTDDCFAAGGPLMTIEAALALVMPRLDRVTEAEEVPLAEAGGRILLADVTSPLELPEAGIRVGDAALATGKRLSPRDFRAQWQERPGTPLSGRSKLDPKSQSLHPARRRRRAHLDRYFQGHACLATHW